MSGSLNSVQLIGRLGRDPEIRSTSSGSKICNMSIATTESWTDRGTGERKEKTFWHNVVVFNEGLVGVCERFLKKGSRTYIAGQLQTRKWQSQGGEDRYATEVVLQGPRCQIVLLDGRQEGQSGQGAGNYEAQRTLDHQAPLDDSIPF